MLNKIRRRLMPTAISDAVHKYHHAREAEGLSPKTLETYHERLNPLVKFLEDKPLSLISPEDIDSYFVALRRRKRKYVNNPYRPSENGGLAPATIEGCKETIKAFFNWCVKRGHIDTSPAAHLKRQKFSRFASKRAMEPETLMQMLAYARLAALARNPIDIRDLALLAFTADTLARVGEVVALNVDDVFWDKCYTDTAGHAVYEAMVDGKVGERLVTFSEQTALYMLDWLDVRPPLETRGLFTGLCRHHFREQHPRCTACRAFGKRMTTNSVRLTFKRIAKRAGIEGKVNPHALRHLGGIVYAERAGIEVAQEKLGHTDILTTRLHYVPSNRDRIRAETARLSPVANEGKRR